MNAGDDNAVPEDLVKENLRLKRRLRQLERVVKNSDQIARQSQAAHRRTVSALEARSAELEEATRQAESAVLAKDLFLATMSHEIRTPMNGVIGCIELIDQSRLNSEQQEITRTLQSSANSLMLLLNDVLDFAKIGEVGTSLEQVPFSISELFEQAAQLHAGVAAQKGVAVFADVDAEVDGMHLGDPHRLLQVVNNLVSNATKFTSEGRVTLRAVRGDGPESVRFIIADTGIGMSTDVLETIFQPFRQADASTTRRFGGTGLGLAICKSLVEAMGGTLQVSSAPGSGSTFSFEIGLPATSSEGLATAVGDSHATPPIPNESAAENSAENEAERPAGTRRVLVVDDNSVNRLVAEKMLKRLGYEPTLAAGGAEAVSLAFTESWHTILMDCSMPDVDGFEATRRIRADEPDGRRLRIIALTAFALQGDRERCLEAGMDAHQTKPLKLETLRVLLDETSEHRKSA